MANKYNEEEKKRYIKEYRKSGLNIHKYAKKIGIPRATLYRWIKEDEEFGFCEIKEIQTNEGMSNSEKRRAVFENDMIRIELREGFNKDFVLKMVEVMVNA